MIFYPNYIHYKGYSAAAEPSVTGETYSCSGAETSGPAYDLIDTRRDTLLTIDTNAQTTEPIIDFDLSAQISPNFCIVDNHNIDTADGQIKVQYGSSPADRSLTSAYSGAYGAELTTESVSSNYVQNPTDGILLMLFSAVTSAYWNLKFLYDPTSYDAAITLAEVVLGVKVQPSHMPDAYPLTPYQYPESGFTKSRAGKKYGFNPGTSQRAWEISWSYMTETDKTNMETLFDVVEGSKYPFYVDFELDSNPRLFLVRFLDDRLPFGDKGGDAYSLKIRIEEEA